MKTIVNKCRIYCSIINKQIGKAGQSTEELVANIQSVLSVVKKTVDRVSSLIIYKTFWW